MKTKKIFIICRAAIVATLYFVLSIAVPAISFGTFQFRISEALTLFPVIMPESIIGLAIGCFFTNIFFSPYGVLDMIIGTLTTTIAAALTYLLRKKIVIAAIPPIILNALFVPLIWVIQGLDTIYYINMLSILLSQTIIIYALGFPLTIGLKKVLPKILYAHKYKKKIEKSSDTSLTEDKVIEKNSNFKISDENNLTQNGKDFDKNN